MMTTKKTMWVICCMVLMGVSEKAIADTWYNKIQKEENIQQKEMPNPEKTAKKRTKEMDKVLQLTEKQYKKIYKLLLKEEREKLEGRIGHMPMGRPEGMHGFPPMGGGQPGGFGNAPSERRPPMEAPEGGDKRVEKEAKKYKKKMKKLRKILTEEQYAKWLEINPEPPVPAQDGAAFAQKPECPTVKSSKE